MGARKKARAGRRRKRVRAAFDTSALYTGSAHYLVRRGVAEFLRDSRKHDDVILDWFLPEVVRRERLYQMALRADELLTHVKKLEQLLNPDIFVRVHRSTIVNRHRVRSLRPHRNGEYYLTLNCDHELKLSRKYKANVSRFAQAI